MPEDLILLGSGGHAKVIIDIIEQVNLQNKPEPSFNLRGLIDNNPDLKEQQVLGYKILGSDALLSQLIFKYPALKAVIAVGNIEIRYKLAKLLDEVKIKSITLEHPSFQRAINTTIKEGTVVMANTAINTESIVGKHCIINTGATIDHDNIICDFSNISPGCHLGGNVRIGSKTMLGIGVNVLPGISIGKNTIIGAGSTVIKDIPDNVMAFGTPAKIIRDND